MKKLILAVLCLYLVACGTFNVKVDVVPSATAPVRATLVVPTSAPATSTATPTQTPTLTPIPTEVDPAITLTGIQMSDDLQGWGVTSLGRIVKTANRGLFWHDITPSEGGFERGGLFALSDNLAWAVPASFDQLNRIWRTIDGGSNWTLSGPIPVGEGVYTPLRLQFADDQHGWLLVLAENGEQDSHLTLYKTDDGGAAWMQITSLTERLEQEYLPAGTTMAFFDGQRGWMGGAWGPQDPTEWLMLKTSNGGESWGTDTFRLPKQKGIECDGRSIVDLPPGALAVEVICTIPKDAKYLYHRLFYLSKKTGPEWHNWTLPGKLLSINFLNINQGWMLVTSDDPGSNKLLYTPDGGDSWKTINKVNWKNARFDFVTAKIGWAIVGVGSDTSLFHTEDGGKTWTQIRPFVSE